MSHCSLGKIHFIAALKHSSLCERKFEALNRIESTEQKDDQQVSMLPSVQEVENENLFLLVGLSSSWSVPIVYTLHK